MGRTTGLPKPPLPGLSLAEMKGRVAVTAPEYNGASIWENGLGFDFWGDPLWAGGRWSVSICPEKGKRVCWVARYFDDGDPAMPLYSGVGHSPESAIENRQIEPLYTALLDQRAPRIGR